MSWLTTIVCIVLIAVLVLVTACAPAGPTATPAKPAPAGPTSAATAPAAAKTEPAATSKPAATVATPAKIKRGGTLRTRVVPEPYSLDPNRLSSGRESTFSLFDTPILWKADDKGVWGAQPLLAESWDLQPKSVTFKLRKGVKFHDGTEFTAEDLAFNVNRQFDPKSQQQANTTCIDANKKAEVIDPYTVKINMRGPCGPFLALMGSAHFRPLNVVPKAALQKMGDDAFGRNPVGTGPFQFVEWKDADHITMKKFDGYWQKGDDGQPLPYLDGIVYRVIGNASVAALELRTGNIDFMIDVDGKDFAAVESNPDLVFLAEKWAGRLPRMGFSATNGPFKDNLKLRQAALYAIDRDSLAKTIGFGKALGARYFVWPPGLIGYDESVPNYWYDQSKAKQLLSEAGHPNGIDITVTTQRDPVRSKTAEIVKQMWDTIGIRTTIEVMEDAAWTKKIVLGPGEYDSAGPGCCTSPLDPGPSLMDLLHSTGSYNFAHHSSPEMDKCLEDGEATYDAKERNQIYKRCQELDYQNPYYAYLYFLPSALAYRKYVKGLEPPFAFNVLYKTVWLDK